MQLHFGWNLTFSPAVYFCYKSEITSSEFCPYLSKPINIATYINVSALANFIY